MRRVDSQTFAPPTKNKAGYTDTRQSSRGRLGSSNNAKNACNLKTLWTVRRTDWHGKVRSRVSATEENVNGHEKEIRCSCFDKIHQLWPARNTHTHTHTHNHTHTHTLRKQNKLIIGGLNDIRCPVVTFVLSKIKSLHFSKTANRPTDRQTYQLYSRD